MTIGLKCAPESGPKVAINTTSMAPVATLLASNAIAEFPSASVSHDSRAYDGSNEESSSKELSEDCRAIRVLHYFFPLLADFYECRST